MSCLWCLFASSLVSGLGGTDESRIHFRSGGALAGKVVAETKDAGKSYVVIKTESGSIFKIEKSKIRRVSKPGPELLSYQKQLGSVDLSQSAGHWKMYNWCKASDGRSRLRDRMKFHLKEIVRLDPSDDAAWRRLGELGEPYVKIDGVWVPEEQHFSSLGYVKMKGHWTPKVLLPERQKQQAADEHLDSRMRQLKLWKKNTLRKRSPTEVKKELMRVLDPVTIGFFEEQILREEKSSSWRGLFLEAIGAEETRQAQNILVRYAINDSNFEVRESAISQLEQEAYSPKSTVAIAANYLGHKDNVVVNRAGVLIGRIGHSNGIVPLIGSLTTQHKEATGNDPGRTNAGFGGTGGNSFSFGEKPKFRVVTRDNDSVRQALFNITGQDFGFEVAEWRDWYISEHTVTSYNVREESDE